MSKKMLLKLINNLFKVSFLNNKLNQKKVLANVKLLKKLPKDKAIFAISQYLKRIKIEIEKHTLVVESSVPLDSQQKKMITSQFKENNLYAINYTLNPVLLGGLRVRIGDNVFDDSIQSRIEQVKGVISQG